MAASTYYTAVQQLYVAYFGRPADAAGLEYYATLLDQRGGSTVAMMDDFANSAESKALYNQSTTSAKINAMYQTMFGHDADTSGLLYWTTQVQTGKVLLSEASRVIAYNAAAADKAIYEAKVTAAAAFTAKIDTTAEVLAYESQASTGRTWLGTVVDTATATAAQATIDATLTAVVDAQNTASTVGQTFTLTTGLDTVTGSAGNDTINATYDGAATGTFAVVDGINGGAGSDILNIIASDDAVVSLPGAAVTGVETINVRNVDGDAAPQVLTVNASNFIGATAINSDRSSDSVTISNLAAGASAGVIGNSTVVNGALVAGYVAAADAATLNIANGTKGGAVTVTGAGLKTLTVNSTGAANTIGALTGAASTTSTTIDATANLTTGAVTNAGATLTIKGAGAVDISAAALQAGVTKVDASATTGGVTVVLGSDVTQAVTGGSGNDVITSGAILTTGSVNAGAGTDTLVLGANVAHANTAALAAKYTNFETLSVNGTFDASLIAGISAIELTGAVNNISKLSATQAGAVTALADIGATTLALATDTGTTDVVSLSLGNGKGAAFDTGALTVNGIETLNIKANAKAGNADQTSVIASFVADKLTAINLTGSAVTLTDAATTKAVTIDASALTGDGAATPVGLTISGNLVTGSTVTGSAVGDTFNAGTGFATYNGGAGKDTFNATAAQLNTGADYNVINGGEGTDTLNITGGVALTIVDNNLSKISGVEKIVVTTTAGNAQSIATGGWFDAAFKANGVDLTTTSTTGTIGIDMTSFTGAAKLTTTSTDGNQTIQTGTTGGNDTVTAVAGKGTVSVTTAAGDDVVSVTTAGTAGVEGTITISTGAGNDTITVVNAALGGNGTVTAGAGADKITLGTDVTTVVIGNTDSGITVATADTVIGFVSGTHILKMGTAADATVGVTHNYLEAAAAVADFAAALTAANTSLAALSTENTGAVEAYNVQWDATNAYVFNDTDGNGTADQVVVLVGVTGASIAAADIIA